jgi:hypothetical protein
MYAKYNAPMSPEDIAAIEYNYRFTKRITIPIMATISIGLLGLLIYLDSPWYMITFSTVAVIGLLFYGYGSIGSHQELRSKKEKTIIKGVVTNKKKTGMQYTYYFVEISKQKVLEVDKEIYQQCKLGAIVEIGFIETDVSIKKTITVLGTI